jgi:CubicO group peptidase (beta-lactamase class C family)
VVGRLVEVMSGMPLDKYFEEKIFKPLGMKDTYFYVPDDKTGAPRDHLHAR